MQLHLYNFLDGKDMEELHKMRLEIKQISAYYTLIDGVGKRRKATDDFEPVRQIFRQAGAIRCAHINLAVAGANQLQDSQFVQEQNDIIAIHTYDFLTGDFASTIADAQEKCLKGIFRIRNRYILKLFKQQLKSVAKGLALDYSVENLHHCRKQIKILLYLNEMVGKSFAKRVGLNIGYLALLQDTIGKWHESSVALKALSERESLHGQSFSGLEKQVETLAMVIRILGTDFLVKAQQH